MLRKKTSLKTGYTTGTCAAAAAKAAMVLLLDGGCPGGVSLCVPSGEQLTLHVEEWKLTDAGAVCAVKKDSGDDPDVTNGVLVYAHVQKKDELGVEIDGGAGVGRVTKRGLAIAVGQAAINPVPRQMIEREVRGIMRKHGYKGGVRVVISIPDGERLAQKTFNPRLGIEGGISVLGTSGIVHPMSERSLVESIRLEMNVLREGRCGCVVLTPGNYGETFLKQSLHINQNIVQCSNFVGDALRFTGDLGFEKVLLAGHIGKLIKLAGGIVNLHSSVADCRMELLSAFAAAEGADMELVRQLLRCVVADEALGLLKMAGLLQPTMRRMMERIWFHVARLLPEDATGGVIVYSNEYGTLGMAGQAELLLDELRDGGSEF